MSNDVTESSPYGSSGNVPTDSVVNEEPMATSATPILDAVYTADITTSDTSSQDKKRISQPDDTLYTPQVVKVRRYQLYKSRKES